MPGPARLSAVVTAGPPLLADALSRVLRARGVDVRERGDAGALVIDLAVVDDRGVPDGLSARAIAVVDPPGADPRRSESLRRDHRLHIRVVGDLERVLDRLR